MQKLSTPCIYSRLILERRTLAVPESGHSEPTIPRCQKNIQAIKQMCAPPHPLPIHMSKRSPGAPALRVRRCLTLQAHSLVKSTHHLTYDRLYDTMPVSEFVVSGDISAALQVPVNQVTPPFRQSHTTNNQLHTATYRVVLLCLSRLLTSCASSFT